MESITRNVGELTQLERQVYETVLGQPLRSGQQVVVQLIETGADPREESNNADQALETSTGEAPTNNNGDGARLPDWCNVYRGLSEEEVDAVEASILARDHTSRSVDMGF
jgi:hypothetical protein